MWFPRRGEPNEPAMAICRRCLVLDDCLAFAVANPELQGIWAATSTRERGDFRRGVEARQPRRVLLSPTPPNPEQRARRALRRGQALRAGRA
jgi:hypothetical protein